MIRFAQVALATGALVAAMPAQAADFIVDTTKGSSTGDVYGNTITYKVGSVDRKSTVNVKATAWSRDFNGNYTAGKLGVFNPAGLGIYQAGQNETGSNGLHQIDNVNGWEFIVLQFDQMVSLQSAELTKFAIPGFGPGDNDAFIARGVTSFGAAMTNTTLRGLEASLNYDSSKQSGANWFNSNSDLYRGAAKQTYNLSPDKAGNVWIIGGSFFGPDGLNDAFKLNQIKVTSGVPEPTTWMTMILGFGVVGAALRRRRGAAKTSLA